MILVVGNNGQVALSLAEEGRKRGLDLSCFGRTACDLMQPSAAAEFVRDKQPTAIINAAAYTAVDAAESDEANVIIMNATAPAALAAVARELSIPFIHISTDYVFDGEKPTAYLETDVTGPTGAYGRSKLLGEQQVMAANPDAVIVRTAWVYSPFGKNFLKTMLSLSDREGLGVVADQTGNPTYAPDIASGLLDICKKLLRGQAPGGIYHMSGSGTTSWHGFAEHIFDSAAVHGTKHPTINALTTADYPTPAKRPANSSLNCDKLERTFGVRLPCWRESTRSCVNRLSELGALS